jgi:hypothetical protein
VFLFQLITFILDIFIYTPPLAQTLHDTNPQDSTLSHFRTRHPDLQPSNVIVSNSA